MQSENHAQELSKILGNMRIPPQPELLRIVQNELNSDAPNLDKLTAAISVDGGLTSTILRTINSPYFGMRCEVQSVKHAISLLGADRVYNILSSVLFQITVNSANFVPMPRYWDNASRIAQLCSYLAHRLGIADPDQAYTLGLFYDCGIPVLAQQFDNYKSVLAMQNHDENNNFTDLEDQHFHTNHCVVAYYITRSWGLPRDIREVILSHHDHQGMMSLDPAGKTNRINLLAILKIAEHVASIRRDEYDHEWSRFAPIVNEHLGLSEPDYEELRDDLLDLMD
jgi:HD-like signal output (HDOD) protein